MRIGIDARSLQEQFGGGVTEYARNLLKNIFDIDQENEYFLFLNSLKTKLADQLQPKQPNVKIVAKYIPNKFLNSSFALFKRPYLDEILGRVDVLFFPNINFAAFSPRVKTVLTIHDLSFELMPKFYSPKSRIWHWLAGPRKLINQVNKIIAVSENTAFDLRKYFSVPAEKITVVYSGVNYQDFQDFNPELLLRVRKKYSLPQKYILMLGAGDQRKNSLSLIEAYDRLAQEIAEIPHLVLVGLKSTGPGDGIKIISKSSVKEKVVVYQYLPQADKKAILQAAEVLVYPSYYEGFGFPPLEAMACSVPVIASNNSALPEVVGEAGILINPDDVFELAFALKQILSDNKLRENLINQGKRKAREFSWKQAAKKTIDILVSSL